MHVGEKKTCKNINVNIKVKIKLTLRLNKDPIRHRDKGKV